MRDQRVGAFNSGYALLGLVPGAAKLSCDACIALVAFHGLLCLHLQVQGLQAARMEGQAPLRQVEVELDVHRGGAGALFS